MKFNLKQPVLDYLGDKILVPKVDISGKPVLDDAGDKVMEPEIMRNYIVMALNNQTRDEEPFSAEQKAKIYTLTNKIFKTKEVDLSTTEISFIIERVKKLFSPLVQGRIEDMLEGKEVSIPDKESISDKA